MPRVTPKPISTPVQLGVHQSVSILLTYNKGNRTVRKRVQADVYGPFAVHHSQDRADNNLNINKIPWVTSHAISGHRAGKFSRKEEAVRLAILLDGLGDWSEVKPGDESVIRRVAIPIVKLVRQGKWDEAERLAAKYVLFG